MTQSANPRIITMGFMVAGNLIGAGILGLPVNLGLAGLWPALLGNGLVCLLMYSTACILAGQKSLTESKTADYPTLFQKELGAGGKWVAVAGNLLILYGLLTAYLGGAGQALASMFPLAPPLVFTLLFWGAASGLTLFGMEILRQGNALLMTLLLVSFTALVVFCLQKADVSRLASHDWGFAPATLPILVTAFNFHNLIPTLCRSVEHDHQAVRRAMALGILLGLAMNVVWITAVTAALPLSGNGGVSILSAFQQNQPATVPLAALLHSNVFSVIALVFTLLAITTSYMTTGTALTSFLTDLAGSWSRRPGHGLVAALCFGPPLAVALTYPDLFLTALNVVGGVGIGLIFGVLPALVCIRQSRSRMLTAAGWALLLAFGTVLLLEIGQELGMLQIHPSVEHWNVTVGK